MSPPAHILDRCWGVPVVATFSAFLVFLAPSCAGLLYVLFMDEFGISHERAAWPQSTYTVMSNSIGLVQSVLQQRVPLYYLTLVGVALTCTGLVASAFAPDITWMTALYGGVYGAGAGFSMISLSLYLLLYFDKYRATATAFKYAGWAASGIIGPTLLGYFAEIYGPQGALLLVGAMALHAVPLVMLLGDPQPLTIPVWCARSPPKDPTTPLGQNGVRCLAGGAEMTPKRPLLMGRLTRRYNTNEEASKDPVPKEKPMEKETTKHTSVKILLTDVAKLEVTNPCSANSTLPMNCHTKPVSAKQMRVNSPSLLGHYAALLRNPLFYVLLIAFMTIDYMMTMVDTTIVEYGIDKGVATLKDAKQLQTYTATGQLIGRIVVPFVSDKIANSRCPFTAASLAVAAACLLLISRVNHFGTLAGLTALVGVCEGYLLCIKGVLIGDYLGVETLAAVCGLLGVASVPALLSAPSIIGFFRDKLGSYDKFYWMLAAVSLMSACLMGCIAGMDKVHRKTWLIENPNKKPVGQIVGTAYGTDVASSKDRSSS
ncbi:monocarboxylate transporter 9 isoform X1 [Rhipicephalus sanguineus]|uniref:monocarboxylate transporter 9 isoform X1 n=1 Tax=Rhipicephalus sanguineus TaxID=34632 RepID=UPI0018953204|nr:monocarboxylate transporter 9 isoform X1 [Rhipicephalus sanguineus]